MLQLSQASPARPSDNSNIKMNLSMEQYWNTTDSGIPNYPKKKPVPLSICLPKIPCGLTVLRRVVVSRLSELPVRRATTVDTALARHKTDRSVQYVGDSLFVVAMS